MLASCHSSSRSSALVRAALPQPPATTHRPVAPKARTHRHAPPGSPQQGLGLRHSQTASRRTLPCLLVCSSAGAQKSGSPVPLLRLRLARPDYLAAPSAKAQAIERIELLGQRYDVISTLPRPRCPCASCRLSGQALPPRFGDRAGRAMVVIFHIPVTHPGAQPAPSTCFCPVHLASVPTSALHRLFVADTSRYPDIGHAGPLGARARPFSPANSWP
jgi:hypothetical protein